MKSTIPILSPRISEIGTPKSVLAEKIQAAIDSLQASVKALEETKPDAKDYYQVPDSINIAHSQHLSRVSRVQGVTKELEAILTEIL